ncbi:hypothetical protein OR221_2665, partial [Microbacterium laevaniformans OR221]
MIVALFVLQLHVPSDKNRLNNMQPGRFDSKSSGLFISLFSKLTFCAVEQ